MTFENWMTQRYSYEYSKGEYRDHDMQAAYTAGMQSSTPYTEGYAKGYSDGKSTRDCKDCDNQLYTIGYADGVQAERERCARICQEKADEVRAEGITTQELGFMVLDYEECAAAIRGQKNG